MQNHEISEFIKLAYSKGKVRDIEEAFEEYPVENEWHQGKIENIICEETEQYNIHSIGDYNSYCHTSAYMIKYKHL